MTDEIFLIQDDGRLVEMNEQQYDSEDLLQELLAEYPKLLAGGQIDTASPRKWLLVKREMGVPDQEDGGERWSVDHLFLDQDAVPTLVEVKRSSDTRIRREVVGQMLDYAANAVVYWPVEQIRAEYESRCEKDEIDPEERYSEFMGEDVAPEEFWQKVKVNLQAGKIRMLFVADLIPSELRRIVEFLNEQMAPAEVLAVEIKQFTGQNMKTLVPRVIGKTAAADMRKGVGRESAAKIDEQSFLLKMESEEGSAAVDAAQQVLTWGKNEPLSVNWGSAGFSVGANLKEARHVLFYFYTKGVSITLSHLKKRPPFKSESKRGELVQRLNGIPGIAIPDDKTDGMPRINRSTLEHGTALQEFFKVMEWVVGEIKAS